MAGRFYQSRAAQQQSQADRLFRQVVDAREQLEKLADPDSPPSAKQLDLLAELTVKAAQGSPVVNVGADVVTKRSASERIDAFLGKRKKAPAR